MTGALRLDLGQDEQPLPVDPTALSLNENPFPPLPSVREAIDTAVRAANRYPEFLPERLRRVIGSHIGVDAGQVVIGAGATGVAMQVLSAVTSPGDQIVLTTPTFDGYPILARMARLSPVVIPLDRRGHHDLDAMADAAAGARVVVLCRPHNPTGTLETPADVHRFLLRVPAETVVLIDEAYIEFVARQLRLDTRAIIAQFPNVVVVRTFSKAYGLAGIRVGYGFCAPELARTLWAMQMPFGTASTGVAAVTASYAAEDQLRRRVAAVSAERNFLRSQLSNLGVVSTSSHANFLYLPRRDIPWPEVFADSGLRVRFYGDGGVRITVGERTSSRAVLRTVRAVAQ
ncbi:aspartate aminotransferase [Mycolicibacterium murale]|uniref:Aspartate aminotransferase n=1 Tax=Mycolicibacterium murale TaxID=182220 RepID=A0A7I9WRI4_9MYCO|nr:aminotransferase class I/II-fold pyridoxal phosphate-dependent enzyme [Mycolicibacterium murale]MCV7186147.1 aminotransferase class I/II-fold pyridoxal phosphate-dependent enzyme [Mycolicibacterium murale]GFG60375.1 aspartate aminotransferase [Mycolicibacterium murale]